MRGFLGELIGTMILVVFGIGSGAGLNLKKAYGNGSNWTLITIDWGLAVALGVYVAGKIGSMGHLNPAVTISFAIFGLFPWHQVLPYLTGQFLGAFLGAIIIIVQYYPHFKESKNVEQGNTVGIFATRPAIKSPLFNFLSEVIATFFFIFSMINLGNFTQGLKPLIIGLLVTVVGMALGSTTGFAINPARDFAPRLAYAILPVPNKGTAEWSYAWIPICGPIVGGILATALSVFVK
ncbi:MIP/aquaporin family protein [Ligilactobacillus aviarius]|uniref:MIP/aquaporin family protein n=1 Tax=Ligilactobacillus aviarius TaxID=1606 RepID=UPI0024BBB266|nr:MIP/aquaporin family protein [Ligilactobacillus aviarius]